MKAFFLPIIEILFEAFVKGVSQDAIIEAIKKEMTALARAQVKSELHDDTDPSP